MPAASEPLSADGYWKAIHAAEPQLVECLRAFKAVYEDLGRDKLDLAAKVKSTIAAQHMPFVERLMRLSPPDAVDGKENGATSDNSLRKHQDTLCDALSFLQQAHSILESAPEQEYRRINPPISTLSMRWVFRSRRSFCVAAVCLYDLRTTMPGIAVYFGGSGLSALPPTNPRSSSSQSALSQANSSASSSSLSGSTPKKLQQIEVGGAGSRASLAQQPQHNGPPVGCLHRPASDCGKRAEYSLFVPDSYATDSSPTSASRRGKEGWPLIICLHCTFRDDDEYLLPWMRPATMKQYLLLAPKSVGPTWSFAQPETDIRSVMHALQEVLQSYNVDRSHIFLTGFSDGATFASVLGLSCARLFAGLAPIGGTVPQWLDVDDKTWQGMPMLLIHGTSDMIFSVDKAQAANLRLRSRSPANFSYKEVDGWGHAMTESINEDMVMPFFEKIYRTDSHAV